MPGVGKNSDHCGECKLAQQMIPSQAKDAIRVSLLQITSRRELPGAAKDINAVALALEPFHSHNKNRTFHVCHDVAKVGEHRPVQAHPARACVRRATPEAI